MSKFRQRSLSTMIAVVATTATTAFVSVPAASATGTWGQAARAVFAPGAQFSRPLASFNAVSCATAGNCTAVGEFRNKAGFLEAFTMTSKKGKWGRGAPVRFAAGVQAATPNATLTDVSCATAGNCTAVGRFSNASGEAQEAFTVTSRNGTWGLAAPAVFGAGVQSERPLAQFNSVACATAGNCTAVGSFSTFGGYGAFTMTSRNGTWGQAAIPVFALGAGNLVEVYLNDVACASAGNCTAVGKALTDAGDYPFTMTSANGAWGQATPAVFAAGMKRPDGSAEFRSVVCATAGNCTAVGTFVNADGNWEAFTMSSRNGAWGQALRAGFAANVQNKNPYANFNAVSCSSAGNCVAVGEFKNRAGAMQSFTMTSKNGKWGNGVATKFPRGVQNSRLGAVLKAVSCASRGGCTAVGQFRNTAAGMEAFSVQSR